MIEGGLKVNFRRYGQMKHQRWAESETKEKESEEEKPKRKSENKEDQSRQALCLFQCFAALEGRTVGLLKRWMRSHLAG